MKIKKIDFFNLNFLIKKINLKSLPAVFLYIFFLGQLKASGISDKYEYFVKKTKADSVYDMSNFTLAAKLYNDLLSYSMHFNHKDSVDIFLNIGISNYQNGNFDKSPSNLNLVLNLLKDQDSERELYIYTMFYLGMSYIKLADFKNSLETFKRVESLLYSTKNTNPNNFINLYLNLAIIHQSLGDFNKSTQFYEKTKRYIDYNELEKYYNYSELCLNLGVLYSLQNDLKKAIPLFKKGIETGEKKDKRMMANAYNAYALALKKSGNYSEAEKYYKKAIENRLKYGFMMSELSKDYHNYGELLLAQKKYAKAHEYLNKAYFQYLKYYGIYSTHTAMCLNSLTDYYYQTNNYSKALEFSQKAIISSTNGFNNNNIFANPQSNQSLSHLELLKALKSKADIMLKSYKQNPQKNFRYLTSSFETYSAAIDVIEEIRRTYTGDESKMYLSEQEKPTYVSAIEVAEILYKVTNNPGYIKKAFIFAEKSKASTLLANIRNNDALEFGKIPSYIRNIEKELKTNIVFEEKLLQRLINDKSATKKEIFDSQNKLFDLKQKLDYFYSYLDKNYKDYYEIKYNRKYATINEIQNNIKSKEAVVEFVLTDNKVISFLITKDYYNIYTTNIDKNFFNNINTLVSFNSTNKYGGNNIDDFKNYIAASNDVYTKLFKKFESKISFNHLIIVPDNQLNLLSFETLIKNSVNTDKIDFAELPYLIKYNPISYSYSATLLFNNFVNDIKFSNNKVLAFAPEYINNGNINTNDNSRNKSLNPLKFTEKEVESISKFFNTSILTGRNANYTNFLKLSKDFDIVHLAMHAEVDDKQPLNSKLLFSNFDNSSIGEKQVTVADIYNMDINSKLLVLSACNTGKGKIRNGEGTLSLARAFMYAGCKSIVMTLWSVEDESSSVLMESFYKNLNKGYTKAKALQLAKVEYLKNNPPSKTHPYFWAGFIPVGDQEPVAKSSKTDINWAFIFIVAGVGFGLTPIFTNRKIKRSIRRKLRSRMLIK